MATLIENNLPYKIYSVVNLGAQEGMFYLGKVPNNLSFSQKVYSDDFYQNCFSGYYFSIASLVPSGDIRLDIADEADTNILIDAKWYDFRPCSTYSCDSTTWQKDNILYSVNYNNPMVTVPSFKSLITDGTVCIGGYESSFYWNDEGAHNAGDTNHCTLYLQAWKYRFENWCEPGAYHATIGTPGESNVVFLMRSLVGRNGIDVIDLGTALQVVYTGKNVCCPPPYPPTTIYCDPYLSEGAGTLI